MGILILENDHQLALTLGELFSEYTVHSSSTLNDAFKVVDQTKIDLALIDRVLDDGDGLELVEYLHDSYYPVRTLVLSNLKSDTDRVNGLENGADDYLAKPFSLAELRLRVENLLDKQKTKRDDYIKIGAVRFEPLQGAVCYGQSKVQLRKKEAALFATLLRYRGSVVTHETLIDGVWLGLAEIPTLSTINVYIRRIRLKLGPHHHLIKTVRGFGYTVTGD